MQTNQYAVNRSVTERSPIGRMDREQHFRLSPTLRFRGPAQQLIPKLVRALHQDRGLLDCKALRDKGTRAAEVRLAARCRHGPVAASNTEAKLIRYGERDHQIELHTLPVAALW
jgi:hypothetical protein